MSLDDIARPIVDWHDREWPGVDGQPASIEAVALKLGEEVGELLGAIVKQRQGRTDKPWLNEAAKEYGDVLIVMCVLADRLRSLAGTDEFGELTPESMLAGRWESVSERRGDTHRLQPEAVAE